MARSRRTTDNVRASRDGHEYHEVLAARYALQLVRPNSNLTAIAVEGLSPADQASASKATSEIADITLYFGSNPNLTEAERTTLIQFKYSVASADKPFRVSNAKKTIKKFCRTYLECKNSLGSISLKKKLEFKIITNQSISDSFLEAVDSIASNVPCYGDVKKQAIQFENASGLSGKALIEFAQIFEAIGPTSSLPEEKTYLKNLLRTWSANSSQLTEIRLAELNRLVREKAGFSGTDRNLIRRTDVLATLQIDDPTDLFPCESRLPDVSSVLERAQLHDALTQVPQMNTPLLIQASSGIGKTVFLSSLATKLASVHEVVFFDCFAGGVYRSVEDARHLPKNGLIHIANKLAFSGLCDPMLPGSTDVQSLFKAFRRRIYQCLDTAAKITPDRMLILIIDAIDNAVLAATQRSEDCFPTMLLESLDTDPIPRFNLIVSCRPERNPIANLKHELINLHPFTRAETAAFLRKRIKNPSDEKISVAQVISAGNPRVLEYILNFDNGALDVSETDRPIEIDDIIVKQVTDAFQTAINRGTKQRDIDEFLAGLTVLPPPIPLAEYANLNGVELNAIESFIADLHPLLGRTSQGIIFRDEPTETLISKRYASSMEVLCRVASNLLARQDVSVYAATALPGLLQRLDKTDQLFALAFDNRIPSAITSTVGKRNVRYARLKAATLHAALKKDHNKLVQLLLEFSTIAATDQRGSNYIRDHPDLVVAARDVDAVRRLFEEKTGWPGTRHARLAIAHTLSGEFDESCRHAYRADEWIADYMRKQHQDDPSIEGPQHADMAAIPFSLISVGRGEKAGHYLKNFCDWYAFEVCEFIFAYTNLAQSISVISPQQTDRFVGTLTSIGALAATLSFCELPQAKCKDLVTDLARCCKRTEKLNLPDAYDREGRYQLQDGLRKSAAISLSLGLLSEATAISFLDQQKHPQLWAFERVAFYHRDVFSFLFRIALCATVKKNPLHEKDLLPQELVPICSQISRNVTGRAFRKALQNRIVKYATKGSRKDGKSATSKSLNDDDLRGAERFVTQRLELLLTLVRSFAGVLGADPSNSNDAFCELIAAWDLSLKKGNSYGNRETKIFFRLLGFDLLFFSFWSRSDLNLAVIKRFLTAAQRQGVELENLIRIIAILAQRESLKALAGEQAMRASTLIQEEKEVDSRAALFGALARAMLPASIEEASVYFRRGLEQIDAIGSGDYEFTNELLLFASAMKGDELDETVFHTLTNICELNIGEDPAKFFWNAYGRGISKAAGLRGLAKLSRWDDRSRIGLEITLLPYLTGLLEHGKINGRDAVALKHLVDPVECYLADKKEFAEALRRRVGPDRVPIEELLIQSEDDNCDGMIDDAVKTFSTPTTEVFGLDLELSKNLASSRLHDATIGEDRYERSNQGNSKDVESHTDLGETWDALRRILTGADRIDEAFLTNAIGKFNSLDNAYAVKGKFFAELRNRVSYEYRGKYIRHIAESKNLFFPWKIAELKDAKVAWKESSATLADVYTELAKPLIEAHVGDLIECGSLLGSRVKKISDVTGVAVSDLTIELIKICTRLDNKISGAVWLGLGTSICLQAETRYGQLAVERLLRSEAAKLSDSVTDGAWSPGLYPPDEFSEIAGGLVWRVLGSPDAIDRWRATYCLRMFAKFGRWEVIDSVVAKIGNVDAGPFQASELPFFYMHANLWLLIALARISRDSPQRIADYKNQFLSYVLEDKESNHVLMRHFARDALLTCMDANELELDAETATQVRDANRSIRRHIKDESRSDKNLYFRPPESNQEAKVKFQLDYDFQKFDVDGLARVFGQPSWMVADMISEVAHRIEPAVKGMHELAGRESPYRYGPYECNMRYHTYGQQLGWHSLLLTATRLLKDYPVIDDMWCDGNSWDEWFSGYRLTRDDGLWLSDGTDGIPFDESVRLLEVENREHVITGSQTKILSLALLGSGVGDEVVIDGRWSSIDNVKVSICSALVPSRKSAKLARKLIQTEPINVFLPYVHEDEGGSENTRESEKEFTPWIVAPSGERRLDVYDPHGAFFANFRPYLARDFRELCSLSKDDPFGRVWRDRSGRRALSAQAWREGEQDDLHGGIRLCCTSSVLKRILTVSKKDLLVLIKLERYGRDSFRSSSEIAHTVAVARVTKASHLDYFEGRINNVFKARW